ncbi:MAG: molybdenum cofactor biosynthesis protein B [Myxococcales bacterium]|nr:molybdenum cofactor biosynthesis protein B [Myxococcales bacterium]
METQTTVRCAVLTVSDTRTLDTDRSGGIVCERLTGWGHEIVDRRIVTDDLDQIRAVVAAWVHNPNIDVVITTGGTGITQRDVTPEALQPLGTKHLAGFGELFRFLSYQEIGTATIQSRADAWLCESTLLFILPGSTGAVTLAMDRILREQLDSRYKPCNFIELLPRIRHDPKPKDHHHQ